MNYAVYISGEGARIKKALKSSITFANKIKVIISDGKKSIGLNENIKDGNIKFFHVNLNDAEKAGKDKNLFLSDIMNDIFSQEKIDYCFCFGTRILKGKLLENYKYRIINFHPSILPSYSGFFAVDRAIENKERYLGNTAHFIDDGADTGPIILQNITMAESYYKNSYDGVLDEQILLMQKLDELLTQNRIHVIDGKVNIEGADYCVSNIYPKV